MQKGQWKSAIKISKKAKDRSIYNFIKWRHLLTTGNLSHFLITKSLSRKIQIIQE